MHEFDWIIDEYRTRKEDRGELINHMADARDHFNGDVVIPMPEMDEDEKPAVANLMAQGLDQTAMRVASVLPNLHFPAMVPGRDTGPGSEDWAYRRKMAATNWWQESKLNLKLRRMARWAIGYSTAPMLVRPNFAKGIPEYVLRNPLSTFPAPNVDYDDEQPTDFIYSYRRTFRWLRENHSDAAAAFMNRYRGTPKDSHVIELLEYIDAEERVLGVIASRPRMGNGGLWLPTDVSDHASVSGYEISRVPNRAGVCWGVTADRISIDKAQGQFSQVFGIYQNQAQLMALESIAVRKAIFPDLVLQATTPGRTPILVGGQWKDGMTGEINVVRDGTVQALQLNPGFMTQPLMDRHERSIRQAGVPSQFSGETPTGISTGRMGDQILSASVDYPIQEYQEVLANTLQESNRRAIAVAKSYFGEDKKSFYVGFNGTAGRAEYKPNTHFETDDHRVIYSAPGADVNSLVIGIGQRVGIGTMSKWTAMQQDPMVPDGDFEYRKVTSERVQAALLDFVSQSVASGAMDPQDVVLLWEQVEQGANIADAWKKAQEAAQKRQAAEMAKQQEAQQAQMMQGAEQMPPDPAMQPGLSGPGPEGAEAGMAIGPPGPSQQNLAQMLGTLRQPRPNTSPLATNNAPVVPVGG